MSLAPWRGVPAPATKCACCAHANETQSENKLISATFMQSGFSEWIQKARARGRDESVGSGFEDLFSMAINEEVISRAEVAEDSHLGPKRNRGVIKGIILTREMKMVADIIVRGFKHQDSI